MSDIITITQGADDDEAVEKHSQGRPKLLRRPAVLGIMIAIGLAFFSITSPKSVPSLVLLAGFVCLGVMLYAVLQLLLQVTALSRRLSSSYRRGIVLTGTILPVLLLMLQSIGQLAVRDVLTLGGLFLLGVFYAARVGRSVQS